MARTATLASLQAQALQRADIPATTTRYASGETAEYVNQSMAELYGILVQSDEDFYTVSVPLTTVSGQADYTFASLVTNNDVLKYRGLDVPTVGGFKRSAERLEWSERNDYTGPMPVFIAGRPLKVHVTKDTLSLYPTPTGGLACTFWYVPNPPRLDVAGTITFDGCSGWEEYIVLDVAAKMLVKDALLEEAGMLLQQKEVLKQGILATRQRDISGPRHISRKRNRASLLGYMRGW